VEPLQNQLFFDCIEDAIGADIQALGGPKKSAAFLFPEKTTEQGSALIRAWLNPERNERPSPAQVLLLKKKAKEVGSFATVSYEAQQLGFEVTWISPEDEKEKLQRDVIAAAQLLKQVASRLEEVERQTRIRSVK
jgi:hypothetical protein